MGKRGYVPKFVKPKFSLEVFRLWDKAAFNAVLYAPSNVRGKMTENEALIRQAISIAIETEKRSKHQKKIAKMRRGAKPKYDTILRSATKERWTSVGLPLKQLEPFLVFPESGDYVAPPPGTHALARISPSSMSNLSRDRDKHAIDVVIAEYLSRRMRYWSRIMGCEL